MATNFVLYWTCSLGAKVSQDPLDRFLQSLHHMVGIELQMNDTSSFLARSAKWPNGLYILPSIISSSFFTMRKAISVSTGPIFTIFSPNGSICVYFLNLVQFFQFLKGRCHGDQFCFVPDLFARSQSISGSAGPIFTIFAPYGRY